MADRAGGAGGGEGAAIAEASEEPRADEDGPGPICAGTAGDGPREAQGLRGALGARGHAGADDGPRGAPDGLHGLVGRRSRSTWV